MRRIIFAGLFLGIAIAFAGLSFGQISQTEREIRDLEEKMNAVYAANDLPTYFAYYFDDFTQWLPEGRTDLPQYKREWTAFIQAGGRIESNQISDLHIQISPGEDTAIASYLAHVKTRSEKGKVSDETFHETDVWFKRDGTWKIVHLHYSPAPEKKRSSRSSPGTTP